MDPITILASYLLLAHPAHAIAASAAQKAKPPRPPAAEASGGAEREQVFQERRPERAERPRPVAKTGIIRQPFTDGQVYPLKLVPGAPFVVELPRGETAKNIWFDPRWWLAESTPGSSRVMIRAVPSHEVVGRKGLLHIETEQTDLRITLRLEAVDEDTEVPAALQLYHEGSALKGPLEAQVVRKAVDSELVYVRKHEQEKARAEFDKWRAAALSNLNVAYEWGGDFRVTRVADDKIQTYVTVPGGSDRAVVQFEDRTGKKEIVNYELSNGVYVIQNKVLRPGEKLRLILGKEQAWIAVK